MPWAPEGSPTIIARSLASDKRQEQCEIFICIAGANRLLENAFDLAEQAKLATQENAVAIAQDKMRIQNLNNSLDTFDLIVYQLQEQMFAVRQALPRNENADKKCENNPIVTCKHTNYSAY